MGLQALIFDVDGTLAETAEIHRAAFNQAFEEFNTGWCWDRRIYSYLMNMVDDTAMLRGFTAINGGKKAFQQITADCLKELSLRKTQIYLSMLADGAAFLRLGVSRLINEAKRDGIALGIVSTRPKIEFETLMTNTMGFESLGFFDAVCCIDSSASSPLLAYQKVLYVLGVAPHKAVAIDDAETGIRDAAICGINTIAVPGIYTSSGRFDAADIVVSDLGRPNEPYNVILGLADWRGYICTPYLREIIGSKQAAA